MNELTAEQLQEWRELAKYARGTMLLSHYGTAINTLLDALAQAQAYIEYVNRIAEGEGFCTFNEWVYLHWDVYQEPTP